jgi:hypothetical protein
VAFPDHTINIVQALELVFIRTLKKLKASAIRDFGGDSVNDQITQLVQAHEQMASSITIHGSFHQVELTLDILSRSFKSKFDEDMLCENNGFREVLNHDVKMEKLSRRRQTHRL